MNLVDEFRRVRDIPYRIPLSEQEKDTCCTGKTEELMGIFRRAGINVRQRVCLFKWNDLGLPAEVLAVPHEDDSSHVYFDAQIGGEWVAIDATWDNALGGIFSVNDWDGTHKTDIAVPSAEILTPQDGAAYLEINNTPQAVAHDLKVNGDFYKALNEYLEDARKKKATCSL
jgi:hypothetical protein